MKFGAFPLDQIEGAVLVHSLRAQGGTLRKGRVLDTSDVSRLRDAGYTKVTVARLEAEDVSENQAAEELADAVAADETVSLGAVGTGRVNIYAAARGIFSFSEDRLNEVNQIDESITIATIQPFAPTDPGQLVATVKIIPFAVAGKTLADCTAVARTAGGLFRIAPYLDRRIGLLQTTLPNHREALLIKGADVTAARVAAMGLRLDEQRTCPHDEASIGKALGQLTAAGCDIVLVLGASAIADRRDVVPAAITQAEGHIEQLGMPVDPGNLTLLAKLGEMSIVGLPGSARSPRTHGSDWIVQRLVAGIDVSATDIRSMGAGGLLKEIPGRPMPRSEASPPQSVMAPIKPNVAAVVLAAGQSRRMGRQNKLLAQVDGAPMVVHTIDAIKRAEIASITVVLGHQANQVKQALDDNTLEYIENPDFAEGLSTSLRRGLSEIPEDADAALICLGDMPRISTEEINSIIAAYAPNEGRAICVPTHNGKRGNPVLLGRRFFAEIQDIAGDVGAKHLIGTYPDLVHEVEMDGDAVLLDIDTPEALARITA